MTIETWGGGGWPHSSVAQGGGPIWPVFAFFLPGAALVFTALATVETWWPFAVQRVRRLGRSIPAGLTSMALAVVGDRRDQYESEWRSHLAGAPENGMVLSAVRRWRYALGFVCAAVKLRAREVGRPLGRPLRWVLRSDGRTNAVTGSAVAALAGYILHDDGVHALLTQGWGPCGSLGAVMHWFTRWLRARCGVRPAAASARQD